MQASRSAIFPLHKRRSVILERKHRFDSAFHSTPSPQAGHQRPVLEALAQEIALNKISRLSTDGADSLRCCPPAARLVHLRFEMAAEVASKQGQQDAHRLVDSLARLSTSDLVRFTLQKPDVARVFAASLHQLAVEAASSPLPITNKAHLAESHVDILAP